MAEDGQKRVLLIEGDHVLREQYRTRLTEAGFSVEEAADSTTAIEALRGLRPDLVLLDLVLKPQNGFTVFESFRNEPGSRAVPVIVLSNSGSSADRARAEALGAADHVVKGQDTPSDVVVMVRRALGGSVEREPLSPSSTPHGPEGAPPAPDESGSESESESDVLLGEDGAEPPAAENSKP